MSRVCAQFSADLLTLHTLRGNSKHAITLEYEKISRYVFCSEGILQNLLWRVIAIYRVFAASTVAY